MGTENHSKPALERFTVRHVPLKGYVVVAPDGAFVSSFTHSKDMAEQAREAKQRAADARTKRGQRRCLTCGDQFMSEGIHNRMCAPCRSRSSHDEAIPFSFGAIHGRKRA